MYQIEIENIDGFISKYPIKCERLEDGLRSIFNSYRSRTMKRLTISKVVPMAVFEVPKGDRTFEELMDMCQPYLYVLEGSKNAVEDAKRGKGV